MAPEQEARQLFAEKINRAGGIYICGEYEPMAIGRTELIDFDQRLKDGTVYTIRNVRCAASRTATREELLENVAAMGGNASAVAADLAFYYELSFD